MAFFRILQPKRRPQDHPSPRAERLLIDARRTAEAYGHPQIETVHVLLGLIDLNRGAGFVTLKKLGVEPARIRRSLMPEILALPRKPHGTAPRHSADCERLLKLAAVEAEACGHTYYGTAHILLALTMTRDQRTARILDMAGVDLIQAQQAARQALAALNPG